MSAARTASFLLGVGVSLLLHHAVREQRKVWIVPTSLTPAVRDDQAQQLRAIRAQTEEVRGLLSRSATVEKELRSAIRSTLNASRELDDPLPVSPPAASTSADTPSTAAGGASVDVDDEAPPPLTTCPKGCTRHGNCDALKGICTCPPTYEGAACDIPTMPACSTRPPGTGTEDDDFVNLSGMASEKFWWMMRDVRPDASDQRRTRPPFRWVGLVTCECVRQSLAVFSLQRSAQPAAWPRYIGHTEISMNRVACVVSPSAATVGELWAGGAEPAKRALRWSYLPIIAWLKPCMHLPTWGLGLGLGLGLA